jgi:aerobic-type carbon monoxide dehydrogenase small subunit (CoxS/CutS family)
MNGEILTDTPEAFVFAAPSGAVRIPYDKINLIEYGQDVSRRVVLAWVVSPMFLLMKSRKHFLTVGFEDAEGHQQALVLLLDKRAVRSTLAALEARSGRTITYLDANARKSHRGG